MRMVAPPVMAAVFAESRVDVSEGHLVVQVGKGFDDRPADSVCAARNDYASFLPVRIFHKDRAKVPFAANPLICSAILRWGQ